MRHNIYIEPDEEITNIIDKLRKSPEKEVAVVAPKGSILLQSMVNLRILNKESKKAKLELDIITNDPVGKNLALQAGIPVFKSIKDKRPVSADIEKPDHAEVIDADSNSGLTEDLKVNYYKKQSTEDENESKFASRQIEPSEKVKENEEDIAEVKEDVDDSEVESIESNSGFVARSAMEVHSRENDPQVEKNNADVEQLQEKVNKPVPPVVSRSTPFKKVSAGKYRRRATLIGVILFIIIIILGCAITLLPRTTITIAIKAEDYAKKIPVIVYSDAGSVGTDATQASVVGTQISAETTSEAEYTSTGKKDVGTKASGDIVVYNGWDTLPHTYPAGTKLSNSGKIFSAKTSFTVPAATLSQGTINPGKVTISIEATETGESYNLQAGKFTITGAPEKIYGESSSTLTGGSTKQLTIVSEADLEKAKEEATQRLKTALFEKIKAENSDFVVLQNALQVELTDSTSSDNAGSEVDKFTYKATGKGTLIIFSYKEVLDKSIESAKKELDEDKTISIPENETVSIDMAGAGISATSLPVEVDLKGKIIPNFDMNSLLEELTFKSDSSARDIIMQKISATEEIEIKHFPGFWKKNALLKNNIKINLGDSK